ncbi:putative F-box/FBD/LRR-repeat protein At5g56810 [Raphanus sativus]|uniref:F-box/FBD/LRR-repeat protein At5g56810 n=1 Tax=Raphanus sativus TaxID=3726 RepID=A0A6J0MNX1_RAPSA|nr:putative F-box/FBD/LRR-repeat protein At5g56810 [Raphanus sativus]
MSAAKLRREDVTFSDMISNLPDDLLLRILSLVPISEAMNTSLLSKRWESLWKMTPVLKYVEKSCPNMTCQGFVEFCRRSLQLHEAPVLKTLIIKLKLQSVPLILPSSFPETVFQKLVVLKLHAIRYLVFDDSPPRKYFSAGKPSVCFRSLKGLHLTRVGFLEEQSFCRLISACPLLEDLFLDTVRTCAPKTIFLPPPQKRLEISTPCLKYLKIKNITGRLIFTNAMPNLVEATLEVDPSQTNGFLRILTSVEFLSINLYADEVLLLADKIYQRLLHLELCIYGKISRNMLLHLLKHSPKLRVLKLQEIHEMLIQPLPTDTYGLCYLEKFNDPPPSFCNPSSVPDCLSFCLETFQWTRYRGTMEEKEVVRYILQNARCLKTASISVSSDGRRYKKKEPLMIKELKYMPKASTSCMLVTRRFTLDFFFCFSSHTQLQFDASPKMQCSYMKLK